MKFNINNSVRVKLTDHGRSVLSMIDYPPPKEDENGWSEWQLWTLMQTFGPHIYLGGENCFEVEIEI